MRSPATPQPVARRAAHTRAPARPWRPTSSPLALPFTGMAPLRPTRREFLTSIGGGLLVLAVPSCGGEGAGGSAGDTRAVSHELGTTNVPVSPERIVAAYGQADLDSLLALGTKPIAAGRSEETGWQPWAEAEGLEGVEPLAVEPEINIEQVAAQNPDLILGQVGAVSEENYPQLSGIAPTVATSFEDWRKSVTQVASAIGQMEDGEEVLSRTDAEIEETEKRLAPYTDLAISVFTVAPDEELNLLTDTSYSGDLMRQMGLQRPPSQTDSDAPEGRQPISGEETNLIDGDVILGLNFPFNTEALDEFERSELFQQLEGVRAGRYIRIGPEESEAMYFASVLTVPVVLRVLEENLGTLDL